MRRVGLRYKWAALLQEADPSHLQLHSWSSRSHTHTLAGPGAPGRVATRVRRHGRKIHQKSLDLDRHFSLK